MSTWATRRRGRGRGRGSTQAGSASSERILAGEVRPPPVNENGPYDRAAGDDALSQAMLRVLERVAGANIGPMNGGPFLNAFGPTELIFLGAYLEWPQMWLSTSWKPQSGSWMTWTAQ